MSLDSPPDPAAQDPQKKRDRCGDTCDSCSDTGCDLPDCPDCGDCTPDCTFVMCGLVVMARILLGACRPSSRPSWSGSERPGLGARAGLRLVRSYQVNVSARRARPVCRMTPSCSSYGAGALRRHGLLRGTRLAYGRVRRCGRPAGHDPVP